MKLALHRSITFWSGILVMGFICWAWRDSYKHWTFLEFKGGQVTPYSGSIFLVRQKAVVDSSFTRTEAGPFMQRFDHFLWPTFITGAQAASRFNDKDWWEKSDADETLEYEMIMMLVGGRPNDWALSMPYWSLLCAVALPWSALLLWRARRRKRLVGLDRQ
ncbi:hypothetical protein OJ996_09060 [Luteolibacter sp. GHJ8]|uniref:Cytochrome c-type biogenesis protein CcmF C-terminal domain-containing protein n=1 Tax=Luteolibacter rhizosphaerae TaxID=2989719 RepID=A0ABT3G1L5_9BACT|nr:hypothetical protein [Luteolibacter rhizosphaerae]MCW1913722.1 hypothetical protein [Luteolibacter rhizosphaerae]